MANWCKSQYVLEGNKEEISKLCSIMSNLQENDDTTIDSLINALGEDPDDFEGPSGSWGNLEVLSDTAIKFSTFTYFEEPEELLYLMIDDTSLNYYMRTVYEDSIEFYTNSLKYFPEKFYIELVIDGEYKEKFCMDENDLKKTIEGTFGKIPSNFTIESIIEDQGLYNEELGCDSFINIYHIQQL